MFFLSLFETKLTLVFFWSFIGFVLFYFSNGYDFYERYAYDKFYLEIFHILLNYILLIAKIYKIDAMLIR
jgi:hypothetical protein